MWATLRKCTKEGRYQSQDARRSINLNEEYLDALRTTSYAEFFTKVQSFITNNSGDHEQPPLNLLEPGQDAFLVVLETAILSRKPDLKALILDYFDISAEASAICSHLLTSIKHIQSNYRCSAAAYLDELPNDQLRSIKSHLDSFSSVLKNRATNPFSDPSHFRLIRDRYSSVLHRLRHKSKQVARRMRLIRWAKKAGGVCATAICGAVVISAALLAAHSLAAFLMGPAVVGFSIPKTLRHIRRHRVAFTFMGCGWQARVGEQLEAAAKGAYILKRDFETMSRLVGRVRDEAEHCEGVVEMWMERSGRKDDCVSIKEVVRELRKSDAGLREQVEELEEHVYLCLLTINRARTLVVSQMTASRLQHF